MTYDPARTPQAAAALADFYSAQAGLQEAERVLFEVYAPVGLDVLDLGVGAGRTTPSLSRGARSYVGVDLSEPMVRRCREAFPALRFEVADATRLALFPDASVDFVLFSFNGLDWVPTVEGRRRCLDECARVLRPGGVFILSVHNARYLFFAPVFAGARGPRLAWRAVYAVWRSLQLLAARLPSRAFWRGDGYVRDPSTPGNTHTWIATAERQADELRAAGFEVERVLPAPDPRPRPTWAVGWYYYACRKPAAARA